MLQPLLLDIRELAEVIGELISVSSKPTWIVSETTYHVWGNLPRTLGKQQKRFGNLLKALANIRRGQTNPKPHWAELSRKRLGGSESTWDVNEPNWDMNEVTYDVENQPTRKSETWAHCKPFSLTAIIQTPSSTDSQQNFLRSTMSKNSAV